jgi:hypothetical protein
MGMKLNISSLLVAMQATLGVDANPTGAANAILLRGKPSLTPQVMTEDQRNILMPYFGNQGSMNSAAFGQLDFEFELAGSGTPGVAPAYGPILRACAISETIMAADVAGMAQAGGTVSSIVLAANSSGVNDFYSGMPISITAGTGAGKSGLILEYNGTTKVANIVSANWVAPDATSAYAIGANVAYRPVSNALEAATMYFNIDGVLHKFLGARGTVSFSLGADKIPFGKAVMTGVYVPVIDSPAPTVNFTKWLRPLIANSVNTPFFSMHGLATAALDTLSLDIANAVQKVSRIGSLQTVEITERKPVANVSMEAVMVAVKDWFGICAASTPGALGVIHGTAAGNRFALTCPSVVPKAPKYADSNGTAMIQMSMDVTPVDGNDEFNFVVY